MRGKAESPGWRKAGSLLATAIRALLVGQIQFRESMRGPNTAVGQTGILQGSCPPPTPHVPGEFGIQGVSLLISVLRNVQRQKPTRNLCDYLITLGSLLSPNRLEFASPMQYHGEAFKVS